MKSQTDIDSAVRKAFNLSESNHHRKIILLYEHQQIWKRYLDSGEISQEDYERIIKAGGGEVVRI